MGRSLKYDIPGRDFRVSEDEIRAQGWDRLFAELPGAASRLVVEIGFGRGEFLRQMAVADPKTAFVGGLFALLYSMTGSLWAPIVVHAAMDLGAGRIGYAASTDETPDSSKPGLAA